MVENNLLEYRRWDSYIIKIQEKIFEIAELEPTIYFKKDNFVWYVMKLNSLINMTQIYIKDHRETISKIGLLVKYVRSREFIIVLKNDIKYMRQENTDFVVPAENYIEKVELAIKIFGLLQLNYSEYELIPKIRKQQVKLSDAIEDIEEKSYVWFQEYLGEL